MRPAQPWIRLIAALAGGLGVAMGAFAAHGVSDPHPRELLRTGALYGMVHAVAALALEVRSPWAALALAAGGLVFSTSLYALAEGAPPLVGAITPLGGLFMLAGWALAAWSGLRGGDKPHTGA
jgi:uncharacterized membrane protein YgdD (TMEM256/DUF423 family)